MMILRRYLLTLFLPLLFPVIGYSAQEARIVTDDAVIFDVPAMTGAPLIRLNRGDIVRISNRHKSGWFHIALPVQIGERRFGWIQSANVEPDTTSRDLRAAGIAIGEVNTRQSDLKTISLMATYSGTYVGLTSLAQAIGSSAESFIGQTFGGGLGWRFSDYWGVILRLERYQFSRATTVTGVETSYNAHGTLLGLLFDYTAYYFRPWRLGIQFGGGVSVGSTLGAGIITTTIIRGRSTSVASDQVSSSFLMPAGAAQLAARYYLGTDVALGANLGYRYMAKNGVAVSNLSVNADLSGPFAEACFQFEF